MLFFVSSFYHLLLCYSLFFYHSITPSFCISLCYSLFLSFYHFLFLSFLMLFLMLFLFLLSSNPIEFLFKFYYKVRPMIIDRSLTEKICHYCWKEVVRVCETRRHRFIMLFFPSVSNGPCVLSVKCMAATCHSSIADSSATCFTIGASACQNRFHFIQTLDNDDDEEDDGNSNDDKRKTRA